MQLQEEASKLLQKYGMTSNSEEMHVCSICYAIVSNECCTTHARQFVSVFFFFLSENDCILLKL